MSARLRRGAPPPDSEYPSSSDNEDAFATLKVKKPRISSPDNEEAPVSSTSVPSTVLITSEASDCNEESNTMAPKKNPVKAAVTSSMKRHHGAISSSRKAKMDALLQELNAEKTIIAKQKQPPNPRVSGSFVQPGEENITSNLFVGNLAPQLTEEQVHDVFVQFGPLHSVKIMWARTPEERSRNRHSGFVCFRYRRDAEAAMNELNDTDAFRVGRYIMVRWGRHVPHHDEEMSVRPKGGGISAGSIQVTVPPDPERVHFISTVAFDVARDERPIEEKLKHDPDFPCSDPERIYYLWCVWKFAHGESWTSWCAEPFTMQEGGPTWIPPPLPHGVDNKEHRNANPKRSLNDTRRRHGATSDGQELTSQELDDFNLLFRRQLTTSRGSICKAMAFCFDKSGSFRHICNMLQELLQEEPAKDMPKDVVMEQKIAQLFLLSDILFNSQQPGVRNAFRYRDAIEKMAPDVFTALGKMEWGGRLTRNKLAVEISSILGAWTNWSVYSPWFLDELHDRFEGRSIKPKESDVTESLTKDDDRPGDINMEPEINATDPQPLPHDECRPKGDWAVIEPLSEMQNETVKTRSNNEECFSISNASCTEGTQPNDLEEDSDVDGDPVDADDIDGEPLEEDVKENPSDEDFDGEPFDDDNVDGELIDEEVDGEPLDDENIDGESVEEGVFEE